MLPVPRGYLLRHGTVHNGSGAAPLLADVRLRGGRIDAIGPSLPADGDDVIDASDLLVVPGLVDLHTHVFPGVGVFSVEPEEAGLATGVTTVLDTGTAGALTYEAFHRYVMPAAAEEIYALLNISMTGCVHRHDVAPFVSDLLDARLCDVPLAVACIERHRDRIVGTKARLTAAIADYRVENERAGLYGALEAAARTGLRCMLHHVASHVPVAEVLGAMRRGDIYTHTYHYHANGPFDASRGGTPTDAAKRARDAGVIFDVGHGMGSFAWAVAESAAGQHGFWPDTISTDIHRFNVDGPVYDMTTTMTKWLHLGMPLPAVVRASTATPADAMGLGDRLGRLAVGRQADVTLLRLERGAFELRDVLGETRVARERLVPVAAFKRGVRHACAPRAPAARL